MHAQGHRQQAGHDAEFFAQQRPGQRHALAGGEHAAGALGPSDRPERVAGACTATAIGGGGRGHRSILWAGGAPVGEISLAVQGGRGGSIHPDAVRESLGAAAQTAAFAQPARDAFVHALSRASLVVAAVAAFGAVLAWRYLPDPELSSSLP